MKKTILILLILTLIFTTACWDMIELEDRLLPYTVAIDLSREDTEEADEKELFICFSYPNINALGKNPTQEDLTYIINSNADSIFEATSEISSRVHNPVFLKHLNVVVMSEEVFSNEKYVRQVLDGLKRDFIINKMIHLLVTKESAHELLLKKLESKRQETIEGLLSTLLLNEQKSTSFTPIRLNEFIQYMDHQRVAIVPLAIPEPEIALEGGGLFKDYEFIGYIEKEDNRNIAILTNKSNNEDIDIEYDGSKISLQLLEIKAKKKLVKNQEVLTIKYNVEMDAQIHQYIIDPSKKIDSTKVLDDIEKKASEVLKEDFATTLEKLQGELNADTLGILEYLYKFHPKIYKEVEGDWDSIFPYINIDLDVKVNIRRRGLSEY
ncbi:MAG: Ger(x)C family spore germination protein [Tissierella sp.]|nr:Ger(x)C family spore germination protein [Tissierella sp.]